MFCVSLVFMDSLTRSRPSPSSAFPLFCVLLPLSRAIPDFMCPAAFLRDIFVLLRAAGALFHFNVPPG